MHVSVSLDLLPATQDSVQSSLRMARLLKLSSRTFDGMVSGVTDHA